jgi:histidinol-phosphate aminotransferase
MTELTTVPGATPTVFQALMRQGIIIRDMNAYGLPEWIRVSIGTAYQNERFLTALAGCLPQPA